MNYLSIKMNTNKQTIFATSVLGKSPLGLSESTTYQDLKRFVL